MDGRTFQKLSSIDNAGCNLEGDDVTLLDISALAFFLSFFFFSQRKTVELESKWIVPALHSEA